LFFAAIFPNKADFDEKINNPHAIQLFRKSSISAAKQLVKLMNDFYDEGME
jgi:hypothetical protein